MPYVLLFFLFSKLFFVPFLGGGFSTSFWFGGFKDCFFILSLCNDKLQILYQYLFQPLPYMRAFLYYLFQYY